MACLKCFSLVIMFVLRHNEVAAQFRGAQYDDLSKYLRSDIGKFEQDNEDGKAISRLRESVVNTLVKDNINEKMRSIGLKLLVALYLWEVEVTNYYDANPSSEQSTSNQAGKAILGYDTDKLKQYLEPNNLLNESTSDIDDNHVPLNHYKKVYFVLNPQALKRHQNKNREKQRNSDDKKQNLRRAGIYEDSNESRPKSSRVRSGGSGGSGGSGRTSIPYISHKYDIYEHD